MSLSGRDASASCLYQTESPKSPPKPNFSNSGLLAKESNQVKGVALKYHEPPEARKPVQNWRLYVFKGDEQVGKCSFGVWDGDVREGYARWVRAIGVTDTRSYPHLSPVMLPGRP